MEPTLNTYRDINYPQQDARGGGNIAGGASITEGNVKLLPWLMFTAILSGVALGMSVLVIVNQNQSESRMRDDIDRQYRQVQEYRIRVEEAENAAAQVNPNFHPIRQPKEH